MPAAEGQSLAVWRWRLSEPHPVARLRALLCAPRGRGRTARRGLGGRRPQQQGHLHRRSAADPAGGLHTRSFLPLAPSIGSHRRTASTVTRGLGLAPSVQRPLLSAAGQASTTPPCRREPAPLPALLGPSPPKHSLAPGDSARPGLSAPERTQVKLPPRPRLTRRLLSGERQRANETAPENGRDWGTAGPRGPPVPSL